MSDELGERTPRFHVCVTCGRLKADELFEDGDCTCQDCHEAGREGVNWHEANDGDCYVKNESATQTHE